VLTNKITVGDDERKTTGLRHQVLFPERTAVEETLEALEILDDDATVISPSKRAICPPTYFDRHLKFFFRGV
jgi:hypothetical protein